MPYTCPVCGYSGLTEPPRSQEGGGSYEICPSCGFQFGVTDDDRGYSYALWRQQWIKSGMHWSSAGIKQPTEWNPVKQLRALGVVSDTE
jgi:hypothetical protein